MAKWRTEHLQRSEARNARTSIAQPGGLGGLFSPAAAFFLFSFFVIVVAFVWVFVMLYRCLLACYS